MSADVGGTIRGRGRRSFHFAALCAGLHMCEASLICRSHSISEPISHSANK